MDTPVSKIPDIYFPMLVSDGNDSLDAKVVMWERFRALEPKKKDILVSIEIAEKLKELQSRFHLSDEEITGVSLMTRMIFLGEFDFVVAETRLGQFLAGSAALPHVRAILTAIQQEVMTIVPAPEPVIEEEPMSAIPSGPTVRLPLLKAMSEYKRLSEQMLTEEKIKLKGSMETVRPSLGNWLKAYREELGVGVHEPVQRGNFLFQSQNGKHLSNEDRARMNLVLKSIEEGFPLEIDPVHQIIVFPRTDDASMELAQVKARPMSRIIRPRGMSDPGSVQAATLSSRPVQSAPAKPSALESFKPLFAKAAAPEKNVSGETLHFSTGHVLPAERESSGLVADGNEALRQMQHPTSSIKREIKAPLTKSPYSIRPLRSRNGDASAE